MVLGLYAFAGAAFLVATRIAGWYTVAPESRLLLMPFVALFGGVVQFLAAMWAHRERDPVGTAMFGTWSAFFAGYGILTYLLPAGRTTDTLAFPELGYWYVVTAVVSWMGMIAVIGRNHVLSLWLASAAIGASLAAVGLIGGYPFVTLISAWAFIVSAVFAWYGGTALLVRAVRGRGLPMGDTRARRASVTVTEPEPLRRAG